MFNKFIIVNVVLSYCLFQGYQCTHLRGTFTSNEFFKFLFKFGFQKTDRHQAEATHGYIFGNITSEHQFTVPITFAVLDNAYFPEFYNNRVINDKNEACKHMFHTLNTKAFDPKCSKTGKDFLRKIPCPKGKLCVNENTPWNVVKEHQFTYVITDYNEPSFRYVSMVACYHNDTTCDWHYYESHTPYEIEYDIWLVNGNPNNSAYNTLTY